MLHSQPILVNRRQRQCVLLILRLQIRIAAQPSIRVSTRFRLALGPPHIWLLLLLEEYAQGALFTHEVRFALELLEEVLLDSSHCLLRL